MKIIDFFKNIFNPVRPRLGTGKKETIFDSYLENMSEAEKKQDFKDLMSFKDYPNLKELSKTKSN